MPRVGGQDPWRGLWSRARQELDARTRVIVPVAVKRDWLAAAGLNWIWQTVAEAEASRGPGYVFGHSLIAETSATNAFRALSSRPHPRTANMPALFSSGSPTGSHSLL